MQKKFSVVFFSFIIAFVSFSPVFAGVYNKMEQVSTGEEYFDDSETMSEEEKNLQGLLEEKEKLEKERAEQRLKAEQEEKEKSLLSSAEDLRSKEIQTLDDKFQADRLAYEETHKCGFFCKVWKVITYPFRKAYDIVT